MKRLIALVSGICLLLCSISAETLFTQRVSAPDAHHPAYSSFSEAFPDLVFNSDNTWFNTTDEFVLALNQNNPPFDLFSLDGHYSRERLMSEEFCADLSQSKIIRATLGRMWPAIVDAATKDGRIYAVPESILLSGFGTCEDAWQAAGLSDIPAPTSYMELLTFLEQWVERIKQTPEPKIRVCNMMDESLYNRRSYVNYLLPVLLDCYTLPMLCEGRMPVFNTEDFRALLERTVNVGIALCEAEPRAGEGNMQLFENELMGFGIIGIKDGYSRAMPLRIRNDQPVLFKGRLSLLCAGAESGQKKLSIDYLEHVITHLSSYTASYAFMDSQALERPHLDEDIADQKKRIDLTIAQLNDSNLSKAKRQELEEQLKRQSNVLKSMQTEDWKYLISPDWLAKYHTAAPHLYFPDAGPYVYTSAEGREMLQLMRRFADDEINVDQFVTGLDLL
ncbi:MAG: hypothetical protein ACOX62_05975 [Christensenellales bacterium]